MRLAALVIGVLVILVGAIGVAAPDVFLSVGRAVITPGGLYAIAALRIGIGLVFVLAAPASRAPRTLRVLGVFVIVAGLATPWFGVARSLAVLDWWASVGPSLRRLDAGLAVALGGLLVYVFRPPTRAN
jgi:hypothetical protein